ncbi:MAG: CDP-diacylglycerol--glycerol-3-phosphate 3-phosphatidyltransferase [Actinomycetota bacterium]|nr:CDP-diacylglycerol--glycerol-3-phosphate 3-phosphatidyltransferase [Actinomycetota bacterium]
MRRVPGTPRRAPVRNVANALTVLRLLLVPVFAALLLHDGGNSPAWRVGACAAFVVVALTDLVDGELARRRGIVTDFGAVADPIADKALTGTALVGLSIVGDLPWVVTLVILAREIGVTLLRLWVIRHAVIAASPGGKLKTALQGVAIALYLLPPAGGLRVVAAAVMGAAVVVTVVTGLDYVVRAVRVRRGAGSAVPPPAGVDPTRVTP